MMKKIIASLVCVFCMLAFVTPVMADMYRGLEINGTLPDGSPVDVRLSAGRENQEVGIAGIDYDDSTKTLTLNGINYPEISLVMYEETKFTIQVYGDNHIQNIEYGNGAYVDIEGTGKLIVNENRKWTSSISGSGSPYISENTALELYNGVPMNDYSTDPNRSSFNVMIFDAFSADGPFLGNHNIREKPDHQNTIGGESGTAITIDESGSAMILDLAPAEGELVKSKFSDYYFVKTTETEGDTVYTTVRQLKKMPGSAEVPYYAYTSYRNTGDYWKDYYEPVSPAQTVTFYPAEGSGGYMVLQDSTGKELYWMTDFSDADGDGNTDERLLCEPVTTVSDYYPVTVDVVRPIPDSPDGVTAEEQLPAGYSFQKRTYYNYFLVNDVLHVDAVPYETDNFSDMSADSPYYDAVYWAAGSGITTGKTATTFAPDAGCTRAQFVTFLWRMQGEPEPQKTAGFTDMVSSTSPFYKAISWAVEQGITSGYTDNTFRPNNTCSRGAAVTFLYRAAGEPVIKNITTDFTDMVAENHAYYKGIAWAIQYNITAGYKDNTFKPFRTCSRGQNVTFLYRAKGMLG